MGRQAGASSGGTGSEWEKNIWKRVWKLECPPRVHHFLWRFGLNSLPLRMNIEKKHVELDTRCAVCNAMFESGGHLFVACREAAKAWKEMKIGRASCRERVCLYV